MRRYIILILAARNTEKLATAAEEGRLVERLREDVRHLVSTRETQTGLEMRFRVQALLAAV